MYRNNLKSTEFRTVLLLSHRGSFNQHIQHVRGPYKEIFGDFEDVVQYMGTIIEPYEHLNSNPLQNYILNGKNSPLGGFGVLPSNVF